MNWLEVSLTVNGELAESVADVLARFAPNGVMTEQGVRFVNDEDEGTATGPITVRAYLEVNDQLEETRQKLEESLFYLGMITPVPIPTYKQIADQNWMEAWKQHYKPILIGEGLLILPAWLDNPDPKRIPIKIDPGMAFGTGTHPTTQLCLELMEISTSHFPLSAYYRSGGFTINHLPWQSWHRSVDLHCLSADRCAGGNNSCGCGLLSTLVLGVAGSLENDYPGCAPADRAR